jgi:hypothetical protein
VASVTDNSNELPSFDHAFFSGAELRATSAEALPRWLTQSRYVREAPDEMGVTLTSFTRSYEELLTIALASVKKGEYQTTPAALTTLIADKPRPYLRVAWVDRLLMTHLGRLYARYAEPQLSDRIFSYRKSKGQHEAVREFSRFLRGRSRCAVFRTDITSFGESLSHDFCISDFVAVVNPSSCLQELFRTFARFSFLDSGRPASFVRGLPMGSHLQLVAENVYLRELDVRLGEIPEGFYARYGDDLVFAHDSPEVVAEVTHIVRDFLRYRQLSMNGSKTSQSIVSGLPALLSSADQPKSLPHQATVPYLGKSITWQGRVLLPSGKVRVVMQFFTAHLQRVLYGSSLPRGGSDRLQFLCYQLQQLLDGVSLFECEPVRAYLQEVRDDEQLRDLDRRLCELVVSLALSKGFKKGYFRQYPPQRLRSFGLHSLVHLRRVGKI